MPVRWRFDDPVNLDTYEFHISPNEGGSLQYKKTINYQNTSAPDGKTLVFEGRDEPKTSEFSGVILDREHYEAMVDWFNRRHQIKVTDDLERQFWIYIVEFTPKRERAAHSPWKHSYTCRYVVLDWES